MSAQCTDERVNKITARIFPKYNTPEKMGALTQEELENEIRDCGLFRAKAKNLLATCHMLVQEYNSTVPDTIEKLMTLPGVGKKTANVIASTGWGLQRVQTRLQPKKNCKRQYPWKNGAMPTTGLSGTAAKFAKRANLCAANVC